MILRTIIAIIVALAIVGNASMSSLSPSTIDLSKIDCKKVVYSGNWGHDKTVEVIETLHRRGQGSTLNLISCHSTDDR